MSDLLETVIAPHGGLRRWNSLRRVAVELSVDGVLWALRGQAGLFANARYDADTLSLNARTTRAALTGLRKRGFAVERIRGRHIDPS